MIVESGNDYLIQVKGNQDKLLTLIKQEALAQKPTDSHESWHKNRGRLEHRRVQLYKAPPHWQQTYVGIACFLVLRRWGLRKGKTYDKTHYYILSRNMQEAAQAGELIRSYWSVENRLHYVKDVTMGEDKNQIAHKQAAKNVSLLKNIALNLMRLKGYKCVKTAIDLHAHNIKTLFQWLL